MSRKLQLPSATAGVFIRQSAPRPARSWCGTTARSATDPMASRMRSQLTSVQSEPTYDLHEIAFVIVGVLEKPTQGRVVVVGAGIDNKIPDVGIGDE